MLWLALAVVATCVFLVCLVMYLRERRRYRRIVQRHEATREERRRAVAERRRLRREQERDEELAHEEAEAEASAADFEARTAAVRAVRLNQQSAEELARQRIAERSRPRITINGQERAMTEEEWASFNQVMQNTGRAMGDTVRNLGETMRQSMMDVATLSSSLMSSIPGEVHTQVRVTRTQTAPQTQAPQMAPRGRRPKDPPTDTRKSSLKILMEDDDE